MIAPTFADEHEQPNGNLKNHKKFENQLHLLLSFAIISFIVGVVWGLIPISKEGML